MTECTPPAEVRRATDAALAGFGPAVSQFRVRPEADRAVRDLLAACRGRGTRVALLLTPEAAPFRAAYPPPALAALDAYTRGLAAEADGGLADARRWLPDDQFTDGHHVDLRGQAAFTDRLAVEVLRPLVAGVR